MCFTLGIKTTKMSTVGVAIRPQQTEMSFKTMSSLNKIYAVIQPTHTKKQEIAPQEKSRHFNSEQKLKISLGKCTWPPWEARSPRPMSCLDFAKLNAAAVVAALFGCDHYCCSLACQKSAMAALQ